MVMLRSLVLNLRRVITPPRHRHTSSRIINALPDPGVHRRRQTGAAFRKPACTQRAIGVRTKRLGGRAGPARAARQRAGFISRLVDIL
ncbi:hypothetical protein EVAR_7669_1 [Eumeta japonica]|uniref:Uncharacterized protein n=1 Tax=Eumeta variegata TaxID=151549 RepID=A0A4C1TJ69_EUMVA|nr:hypothetical protein EVAR_7669_1 [Eumeta japonica]